MSTPADLPGNSPTPGGAPAGVLRLVGDAQAGDLGPNRAVFSLSGDETGGKYSLTEFTMVPPPTPGPPPHIHEDADEAIYVLEGTLEMRIGERRMSGLAGAVMLVPRGTLHPLANPRHRPRPDADHPLAALLQGLLAGDGRASRQAGRPAE
jgi:quercetin dioxygenase-like cupin family protein